MGPTPRATLDESPQAAREVRRAVARCKRGDRDALRLLYVRYSGNVYGYIRSIVKDDKEAEDLTQHVFLKLITAIGKYDDRGIPFSGWLLRLARNVALDHLRRRRPIPAEEVFGADRPSDEGALHRAGSLRAALVALPDEQRTVVRDAPSGGAHPGGDRSADGAHRELDPRPASPRPARAAAGAAPARLRAVHRRGPRLAGGHGGRRGNLAGAWPPVLAAGVLARPFPAGVPPVPSAAPALVPFTRLDAPTPSCLLSCWRTCGAWPRAGPSRSASTSTAFERDFATYCETRFAIGVASGTEALALSLRALRDRAGRRGDRAGQLVHRHRRGRQRGRCDAAPGRRLSATRTC